MKIKFFKPEELEKNLRISIHKTGKLGFTSEGAKKLGLSTEKSADIGVNEDDDNDEHLYLVIHSTKDGGFKIYKAGQYFYLNTKLLFDNLKIDYSKGNVAFEMMPITIEGQRLYKLKKIEKTEKEMEEEQPEQVMND